MHRTHNLFHILWALVQTMQKINQTKVLRLLHSLVSYSHSEQVLCSADVLCKLVYKHFNSIHH